MPALTGPALTAALLLAFAGAAKAVDPVMTAGALRALGLPSSRSWVRVGAAAELLVGLLAAAVGWAWVWWLVVASYLVFGAFVVAALRAGTMVGSCGCFGREDTPPHPIHVVVDVALAATAAAAAVVGVGRATRRDSRRPGERVGRCRAQRVVGVRPLRRPRRPPEGAAPDPTFLRGRADRPACGHRTARDLQREPRPHSAASGSTDHGESKRRAYPLRS